MEAPAIFKLTMKYYINEEAITKEEFNSSLESDIRDDVLERYDDMLDEIYPEVKIGYSTFLASEILRNLDPISYNCGIEDFVDGDLQDALDMLEEEKELSTHKNKYKIVD